MKTDHPATSRMFLLAAALLTALPATADVRLPKIFTDHMMIQRDLPVRVWGWAEAGEPVNVTLSNLPVTTKVPCTEVVNDKDLSTC